MMKKMPEEIKKFLKLEKKGIVSMSGIAAKPP